MVHLRLLALLDPSMDQMEYPSVFELSIFCDVIIPLLQLVPGPLLLIRHIVLSFVTGGVLSGMEGLIFGHVLHSDVAQMRFVRLKTDGKRYFST